MEALNDENDIILTQRENRKMSNLIDAETATWLVEMIGLDNGAAAMQDGYGLMDHGGATMVEDELGEGYNSELGYAARVKEATADLIEIEGRGGELTKRANELGDTLGQLRAKFLIENRVSGSRSGYGLI